MIFGTSIDLDNFIKINKSNLICIKANGILVVVTKNNIEKFIDEDEGFSITINNIVLESMLMTLFLRKLKDNLKIIDAEINMYINNGKVIGSYSYPSKSIRYCDINKYIENCLGNALYLEEDRSSMGKIEFSLFAKTNNYSVSEVNLDYYQYDLILTNTSIYTNWD